MRLSLTAPTDTRPAWRNPGSGLRLRTRNVRLVGGAPESHMSCPAEPGLGERTREYSVRLAGGAPTATTTSLGWRTTAAPSKRLLTGFDSWTGHHEVCRRGPTDKASGYEPDDWRFDSSRRHQRHPARGTATAPPKRGSSGSTPERGTKTKSWRGAIAAIGPHKPDPVRANRTPVTNTQHEFGALASRR